MIRPTIPSDCRCLWACDEAGDWSPAEQHPDCPMHASRGITTLTFTIPPSLWLTANRAPHNRGHRARQVRDLQDIAAMIAREQRAQPIAGQVAVDWTVCYPKGVRKDKGDASNAQPTTKALLDGLVAAGVLEDDGPAWVTSERFSRGPNLTIPRLHEIRLVLTSQHVPF